MKLNRSKTTVVSYLALAVFGVIAGWLSWFYDDYQLEYAIPNVFATLMLFWIPGNRAYVTIPFYRNAWRLNTLLLCLAAAPGLLFHFLT